LTSFPHSSAEKLLKVPIFDQINGIQNL
jgi:hypothetical protein